MPAGGELIDANLTLQYRSPAESQPCSVAALCMPMLTYL